MTFAKAGSLQSALNGKSQIHQQEKMSRVLPIFREDKTAGEIKLK
jgi:hypothetical protein